KFRAMILLSENATMSMFSKNYTKLASSVMVPTSKLFTSLIAHVSGKEVDLQHSVNSFFDDTFPEIYQKLIKSRHKEANTEFVDCLRDAQPDISAFGNIPLQLSLQLEKSFEFAKIVLQSMQVAIEVINRTLNFRISEECTNAFVKLTYCSACSGLHNVKPCNGMCLNVARGCVAQLAELDRPWNEFVIAFEQISTAIIGYQNAENVLASIDSKIFEAIKYAVDNDQEIAKRVKVACGHPKRYLREATTTETSQHNDMSLRPSLPISSLSSSSLYVKLQTFVYQLVESKGFFTNLGDSLCHEDFVSSNTEVNCWNGHVLGEYTKSIAGIGVEAQKFNSEFAASSVKSTEISALTEKLKQIREVLRSKIKTIPESDSFVMNDGSGSGQDFKYNIISDDEDYSESSGSGTDMNEFSSTDSNFDFSDDNGSTVTLAGSPANVPVISLLVSMLSVILSVERLFHCDSA
ncbi:Glypican-5-like protein, partial [Leptotrombidium deliense]